ncbi:MAG TPA: hypothetical protein VFP15_06470 [Gemmatimonadaceae bacterium]|nr:hypothetical protein [Gemmatimonadaceae bacterium]
MGLGGVDNLTCSTLAAQLQASSMEELGGILASLEERYPELKRRLVVALSGYGSEVSPLGLSVRNEWTELLRSGFCFGATFNQPAVAGQSSGVELVTALNQKNLVRSIWVQTSVAAEVVLTDSGGAGFVQQVAPGAAKNLRGGVAPPGNTSTVFAGSAVAILGTQWKRFGIPANTPFEIKGSDFLIETSVVENVAVWTVGFNVALDVSFEWAEPPATWPL